MARLHVLVLQVDGPTMTVLTDAGDFLTLPTPDPAPRKGQQIWVAAPRRQRPALWWGAVAAAAALLVAVLAGRGVLSPGGLAGVAASVTLDINPSLRLDLDARARVVQALPLNESARKLRLPPRGTPLGEALALVVSSAEELGVLSPERDGVIVYSVLTHRGPVPGVDVAPGLQTALSRLGLKARLVPLTPDPDQWKEADRLRISVNRLVILQRARARGVALSLDALEGSGLRRALEASGLLEPVPAPAAPAGPGPIEVPAPIQAPGNLEKGPAPPARPADAPPNVRPPSSPERPQPVGQQPVLPPPAASPVSDDSTSSSGDTSPIQDGATAPAQSTSPMPDGSTSSSPSTSPMPEGSTSPSEPAPSQDETPPVTDDPTTSSMGGSPPAQNKPAAPPGSTSPTPEGSTAPSSPALPGQDDSGAPAPGSSPAPGESTSPSGSPSWGP